MIYGLTHGATGPDGIAHWTDTATILALAGAAAAIIAFVVIEARSRQPLLPLWIFADRNRAGVYLILLCLASTFFGMFFFLTLFTQVVWGYSALRGGLAYLPFVGAFIVVAGICSAGIADEHQGVASSMFNAGQQIGGAVGLAVIGSVAWTVVNRHVRDSLSQVAAGHNLAGHATGPSSPIYDHALSSGITIALTLGAGATVLALIVTVIAIRVRREDLPDSPLVM